MKLIQNYKQFGGSILFLKVGCFNINDGRIRNSSQSNRFNQNKILHQSYKGLSRVMSHRRGLNNNVKKYIKT